jgi:WD40 repeat protein
VPAHPRIRENTSELREQLVANPAHPSYVTRVPVTSDAGSVAISPDGSTLSVGNLDGTASLWNIAKPSHPSLDSQLIPAVRGAAGESTGVLSVNSGSGTTASGSIDQVAFSPNGRVVANGSGDGTISVWDVASPTSPVQLGQPATARGNLFSLAFSHDNTTLLSGGNGGYIWTVPRSQLGVASDVQDVTVAADAPVMATTTNGANLIQLWNVSDPLEPQLIGHIATSATPNVLALTPDGRELAMGSATDAVQVWNVSQPGRPESISQETIPDGIEETPIYSLSLDQAGNSAVAGDENGTIALVDVRQQSLSYLLNMTTAESGPDPEYVAISSDGRSVVSCDNDQGQVILWSTASRGRESSLTMPQSIGGCASATFDTSGSEVSVGSGEGWAWLLEVQQGKHLAQFAAPFAVSGTNGDVSTAFSPGDASLVTSSSGDGLVKLWNIADPSHPVLDGPLNSTSSIGINSLAVGDHGQLVAIGSNDSVGEVWDLNTTSETSIICESTGGGLSRAQWTGYVAQDSYKAECP